MVSKARGQNNWRLGAHFEEILSFSGDSEKSKFVAFNKHCLSSKTRSYITQTEYDSIE